MQIIERNLQKIGQSFLISLPKPWAKALKLQKGSRLKLLVDAGKLSIVPEFVKEAEKKKEISLAFDRHFRLRFFRAYFEGNEKITLLFKQKISEKERSELSKFLRRFMNVQVIEETPEKVVVKSFRIEELSIEECLQRMHFLLLNIFEEASSGSNLPKLKEIRETLLRFYYLLVMQVRRFLSEGKFAEENQISLIRAMDYRMVAEKINRIAEVLVELNAREELQKLLREYKPEYQEAYQHFMHNEYEKASELYFRVLESESRQEKLLGKFTRGRDFKAYRQVLPSGQILRHVKEICMLTK